MSGNTSPVVYHRHPRVVSASMDFGTDAASAGTVTISPAPAASAALSAWLLSGTDVRFGAYITGNDLAGVATWYSEAPASTRRWDIKAYYQLSSTAIPSDLHISQAEAGHPIHVPIALKGGTVAVPARGLPAPAGGTVSGSGIWTYQQFTSGAMDGWLDWLAARLNGMSGSAAPVLLGFNIEPESVSTTTGRREAFSNPLWYANRASLGDAAVRAILKEYGDAYRYVRNYLVSTKGVDNVIFTLNHGALAYTSSWHNTNVYPAMYPGDDVVDVIGWDPYVNTPASQSLLSKLNTTVGWLRGGGFDSAYYRTGTGAKTKPWMLPEYGCTPTTNADAIAWLNHLPTDLTSVPEIKGVCYYSAVGTESTRIDNIPAVRAAFAALSADPMFDD